MTTDEKQKLRAAIKLVRTHCRKESRKLLAKYSKGMNDDLSWQDADWYTAVAEHLNSVNRRLPK